MANKIVIDKVVGGGSILKSPVALLTAAVVALVAFLISQAVRPAADGKAPKFVKESLPFLGSFRFFTHRWDFFREHMARSGTGHFSYYVGKNHVVGVSGEKARKWYFDSRDLNFNDGFAVLFAAGPDTSANGSDEAVRNDFGNYFQRRLVPLLKTDKFVKRLPKILADTRIGIDELAQNPSGVAELYESMYGIIFALTMRMLGADELVDDRKKLKDALYYYEVIESSATPMRIIFPWLPTPAYFTRLWAGYKVFMMFKNVADQRKAEDRKEDDALQFLLDSGDRITDIISFVMGALFAGLLNSGINASAVLCYLAHDGEWQERVYQEVKGVANKFSGKPESPILDQLESVPLEAWEGQFPLVDLCLKESIRLNLLGTSFRKNSTNKTLKIPGSDEVVPPGAFVTYHISDMHHNPDLYPDPMKWDPNRYIAGREEDKKEAYAWAGWGQGRHPCLGMRFAKLEQNITVAYALAQYKWENVDKQGRPVSHIPPIELNNHSTKKPVGGWYTKFTPREAP